MSRCEVEDCAAEATERRPTEETLGTGVWMHLCSEHAKRVDDVRLAEAMRLVERLEPRRH